MSDELKPCPFCQASAFYNFTDAGADRKYYRVHCSKCDARIGHPYIGKDAAREAWNTRTRANERDFLSSQLILAQSHVDRMTPYERSHVQNVIRPAPQPSPQSDMVAVPRKTLDKIMYFLKYLEGWQGKDGDAVVVEVAEDAIALLQPYTKGE